MTSSAPPPRVHIASDRPPAPKVARAEGPPRAFHRTLPGYERTPMVAMDDLADELGVGQLWVKNESSRLGLPSFKILGGSWAVHRLLMSRAGEDPSGTGLADLERVAADLAPLTLTTATDGNHGRGVARMAAMLGLAAVVYVPDDMVAARIAAIESEGAEVIVVDGDYDTAVARSARDGAEHGWEVVADVAYEGYDQVPGWVMDGYDTIFDECGEQLPRPPDVVFIQAGVGALAGATVQHLASLGTGVRFAVVEPGTAACLLESALAGEPVSLDSSQGSIMAGLNCGSPSTVAWPILHGHTDVWLAIDDAWTRQAMRELAAHDIEAGESGAAGLGGLLAVAGDERVREALGLDADASVLVVNTEGATDPDAYHEIVHG